MKMMEKADLLFLKLTDLCAEIYCPPDKKIKYIGSKSLNIQGMLDFAKRNRIAHYFALKNRDWLENDSELKNISKALISEYSRYENNLKNNLSIINRVLSNKEFIVIKTFSSFPHITSDIDVLVKDEYTARMAREAIAKERLNNPLPIDINYRLSWVDTDVIRYDFIWGNVKQFNFHDMIFLVPNSCLDVLIRIAHMPFELAHIKLGELLHIYGQLSFVDYEVLKSETKLTKWPKTFFRMWDMLEMLHLNLFDSNLVLKTALRKVKNPTFPFQLSSYILWGAVWEKKAWGKILGARFILKDRFIECLQRKDR